ncbi:MAG: hypothetical protein F6K28_01475 [Microcoleus sp. SIO2G3]|nr:hypothetical protein [Microcoleus sp. SIO2G3]
MLHSLLFLGYLLSGDLSVRFFFIEQYSLRRSLPRQTLHAIASTAPAKLIPSKHLMMPNQTVALVVYT